LEGYVSEMKLIDYKLWLATGDKKVRVYTAFDEETRRRLKAEDQLKEERLRHRRAELSRISDEQRLRAELEEER
jgi:hypothetical protein